MQVIITDAISRDGIMWAFWYLSALSINFVMFSDGLSEKVPYCSLKVTLCFSTVVFSAPVADPWPAFKLEFSILLVGGRAGSLDFFTAHQLLSNDLYLEVYLNKLTWKNMYNIR